MQRLAAVGWLRTSSTSVVNDTSSTVGMPLVGHGPCSGIGGAAVAVREYTPENQETNCV